MLAKQRIDMECRQSNSRRADSLKTSPRVNNSVPIAMLEASTIQDMGESRIEDCFFGGSGAIR